SKPRLLWLILLWMEIHPLSIPNPAPLLRNNQPIYG
ncbi:hypothetical protein M595_6464, partial [Lyngbya aestuarii BL J]